METGKLEQQNYFYSLKERYKFFLFKKFCLDVKEKIYVAVMVVIYEPISIPKLVTILQWLDACGHDDHPAHACPHSSGIQQCLY